jgi:hypothetical protein
MYTDATGPDPDSSSATLTSYHKLLWSKPLPSGDVFELRDDEPGYYLYHNSHVGEFSLGSDAITHSYRNHHRKKWLTEQIPNDLQELFDVGSAIGAYLVFPNRQINRLPTINQLRGSHAPIDDRFDLTLECIRRFYAYTQSPLTDVLERYASFFRLFESFEGYVEFFLLDDLVDKHGGVNFYLPFEGFASAPGFKDVCDYRSYIAGVERFVRGRNARTERYAARLGG